MVKLTNELVNFVRPSEHSTFSPSGAERWIKCPFSIEAEKRVMAVEEEEVKPYAVEGTLAHQICEDYFDHVYYEKEKTPDLMMASDEMLEGAQMYYDCVTGWMKDEENIGEVLWFGLEKGLPFFPEHDGYGTGDFVLVGTKGCVTVDYKYGKKPVSPKSSQLMTYLLSMYRYLLDLPEDYKFHAVIVQPRTDIIPKVQEYSMADLKQYEAVVYQAILKSKRDDLEPVEGNHCFWCKARRTNNPEVKCPAIADKALKVANENFDQFLADMNEPPVKNGAPNNKRDKALMKIMSLLPLMQQVAKDAEEEFRYRMEEQGEVIEGVTIVDSVGRSKWKLDDPKEMIAEIKKIYPEVEAGYMTQPVLKVNTITKIKKQVGKDFDESLIVKPIKKKVHIEDRTTKEVLGELTQYGKMIGLSIDN